MLANWTGQWVNLRLYGPPDKLALGYAAVAVVDYSIIPMFLLLCLMRDPIKAYFSAGR
jgi:hypothetical protein